MENFDQFYREQKQADEKRAAELVRALTKAGRLEELFKASESAQYRELLYKEFDIKLEAMA